jgi:hypothetical protein
MFKRREGNSSVGGVKGNFKESAFAKIQIFYNDFGYTHTNRSTCGVKLPSFHFTGKNFAQYIIQRI